MQGINFVLTVELKLIRVRVANLKFIEFNVQFCRSEGSNLADNNGGTTKSANGHAAVWAFGPLAAWPNGCKAVWPNS